MLRPLLIMGLTLMVAAMIATAMFPIAGLVVTWALWVTLATAAGVPAIWGVRWLQTELRWRHEVRGLSRNVAPVPFEPAAPSLVELQESA